MAILVALSGAVLMAVVNVLVKQMAATERAETLLVYSAGIATLVALVPSLFVWRDPTLRELAFLVLIGALGSAGQYCVIRGFKVGEATALLPFDYSRLLFAGLLGFLVFAEVPDVWTISGAAIIVAATLYIGLRESRIGRRPASPPAETR
jgi:drug/metabolite transporter (DMT)-like permease